ncbi:hypothetical protein HK405_010735, partial [Cladochytrium tenue]
MPADPLSSLTVAEVEAAVAAVRATAAAASSLPALPTAVAQAVGAGTAAFNSIAVLEPAARELDAYYAGGDGAAAPARVALVTMMAPDGSVAEVDVDLTEKKVIAVREVPKGLQPTLTPDDCFEAERIAISDPAVLAEVKACDCPDTALIVCDPWSVGYIAEHEGKRLVQLFMYVRLEEEDNHYAHPLDFVPVVDLISKTVVQIDYLPERAKRGAPVRLPLRKRNYLSKYVPEGRDGVLSGGALLAPLEVVQRDGPSFQVLEDGEVAWHRFRMRLSWNYREGLVLHNVKWVQADGEARSIMRRAALNEMVVPYGDPRPPYNRKTAFDVGDYGLGYCANSLELGCDCLGVIKYFDAVMNNNKGEPVVLKNAICMHEEDVGISWKHVEYRTGKADVRRNRRLVISFIATVVNYEYAFYWYFYVDGTIQFEIKATGELSINSVDPADPPPKYGTLVGEGLNAQFHQHLFNIRLDMAVDGPANSVAESVVVPVPEDGDENPFGNGFMVQDTLLGSTLAACRDADPILNKTWKIFNPSRTCKSTRKPTAFRLVPLATPVMLARPGSSIARRAAFASHHLWVTRRSDEPRWAAGTYINQNK